MRRFDAVIFDLDGTLLYTIEDLCDSVNYALAEHSFPLITLEQATAFVGSGIESLIASSVPAGCDEAERLDCLRVFREHYSQNAENKTRPYDGIIQMLRTLEENGIKTGVVSNKFDTGVQRLCRNYFGSLIYTAVGEGGGIRKKPYPDGVEAVLGRLGVSAQKTAYVGDSDVDMQTARGAGLYAIGVSWGYRPVSVIKAAGADTVVNSPEEIPEVII